MVSPAGARHALSRRTLPALLLSAAAVVAGADGATSSTSVPPHTTGPPSSPSPSAYIPPSTSPSPSPSSKSPIISSSSSQSFYYPPTASLGTTGCSADCSISFPNPIEYTWASLSYEASTTINVTVATLIFIVDDTTNQTSTSTEYAPSTVTEALPNPTATKTQTISYYRGPGDFVTTTIVFPTPLVDYYDQYTILGGGRLLTESTCHSFSTAQTLRPSSHPPAPAPSEDIVTDKEDRYGSGYTALRNNRLDTVRPLFSEFYKSAFASDAGVASCGTIVPTTAGTTRIGSSLALTSPSTSAPFAGGGPGFSSPPQETFTSTENSLNPLTHTSVAYLTGRSTRHVANAPWATSNAPEGQGSPSGYHQPTTPEADHTPTPTTGSGGHKGGNGGGNDGYGHSDQPQQTTKPAAPPQQAPPTTAYVGISHTSYPVQPTHDGTTPAVVVDGQTVKLGDTSANIHGTPIQLIVTTDEGGSPVTEAVVGTGDSQTIVPIAFPSAGSTGGLGGYIVSGLGGGSSSSSGSGSGSSDNGDSGSSSGSGSSDDSGSGGSSDGSSGSSSATPTTGPGQANGGSAGVAEAMTSRGSVFGLVVAGAVVGFLI